MPELKPRIHLIIESSPFSQPGVDSLKEPNVLHHERFSPVRRASDGLAGKHLVNHLSYLEKIYNQTITKQQSSSLKQLQEENLQLQVRSFGICWYLCLHLYSVHSSSEYILNPQRQVRCFYICTCIFICLFLYVFGFLCLRIYAESKAACQCQLSIWALGRR